MKLYSCFVYLSDYLKNSQTFQAINFWDLVLDRIFEYMAQRSFSFIKHRLHQRLQVQSALRGYVDDSW